MDRQEQIKIEKEITELKKEEKRIFKLIEIDRKAKSRKSYWADREWLKINNIKQDFFEKGNSLGGYTGFARGVSYAIALLWRDKGDEDTAIYIMNESGFKLKDFKEAKIDDYDLDEIKKVAKEL